MVKVIDGLEKPTMSKASKRRRTIFGFEIKKENEITDSENFCKEKRPKLKRSNSSSRLGEVSSVTSLAPQNNATLNGIFRTSLRRKVSSCVLKHTLKTLQDYTLPSSLESIAQKRLCNKDQKPVPPLKPARKRTSKPRALKKQVPSDNDLQQKIDHEIKMREGTTRLLAACKHPTQVLEATKNLLSSNTRIISYMSELQRRKTAEVLGKQSFHEGNQLPCTAQVSVSDIRIPLMWKDVDHFKHKGDYRCYAVFCILKIGTEIYDTSMIMDVDRSMTDISFEDVLLFENTPHDFVLNLEVYCHKLHEDMSVANTPKKLKKKINDLSGSVGRSVGKRLSGLDDTDVIGNMVLKFCSMGWGPKFELVAKGSLSLSNVDNSVKSFDLQLETNSDGQVHELPLFGHYCCRLAALPHCLVKATTTGFLNLQEDDDLLKWKRYWCTLKNLQLACWSSPDDVEVAQPLLTIPVTKSTQISDADPSTSEKPHSFLIKTVNQEGIFQHTLATDSKEELGQWWDGFQQHLLDQALWKHACDRQMDLKVKGRVPVFTRKSSLYDDTPLIEPESGSESLVGDLGMGDDQLSQMIHTLMGEADQVRRGASSRSLSTKERQSTEEF